MPYVARVLGSRPTVYIHPPDPPMKRNHAHGRALTNSSFLAVRRLAVGACPVQPVFAHLENIEEHVETWIGISAALSRKRAHAMAESDSDRKTRGAPNVMFQAQLNAPGKYSMICRSKK